MTTRNKSMCPLPRSHGHIEVEATSNCSSSRYSANAVSQRCCRNKEKGKDDIVFTEQWRVRNEQKHRERHQKNEKNEQHSHHTYQTDAVNERQLFHDAAIVRTMRFDVMVSSNGIDMCVSKRKLRDWYKLRGYIRCCRICTLGYVAY
jgi:hypothetical protein